MKKKYLRNLAVILFFLLLVPLTKAADQESALGPCGDLLKNRCEGCHYNTRICQKLGKKSKRAWKRTIKAMVKRGAKLSADEKKTLLKCLSKPTNGVDNYCRQP